MDDVRGRQYIWEEAGALGMSAKTLDKVYGHHRVDFQKNVAEV